MNNNCKNSDIHGILLIDKPSGLSSNNTLQKVKNIYQAKRAGYIGTLDPLSTGMLPICFGKATKFSQFLSNTDKFYYVIARLGQTTDTYDSYGRITSEKPVFFTKKHLQKIINNFLGEISQIPPIYSAIKYNGMPLYKYARKGIKIPIINSRKVKIYEIKIVYLKKNEIALNIYCSKGTYIRSIIHDLGNQLKCGAHVISLRRLYLANYKKKNMITLKYLENLTYYNKKLQYSIIQKKLISLLISIENALFFLPEINLVEKEILLLKNGIPVKLKNNNYSCIRNEFRITSGVLRKFIGVGKINNNFFIQPYCLMV